MNEIKKFANEKFGEIRTVMIDNEPWWVAKDICEAFSETNRNRVMQYLDDDEKGYTQIATPGGMQKMVIVNESGLYHMLFVMQPEKARGVSDEYVQKRTEQLKAFKRWVTHEVLPSIRRTGTYSTGPQLKTAPLPPESASGVAKLITVIRLVMRDNGQAPEAVSQAVKGLCEQFGVILPANFVRESPFEQLCFDSLKGSAS